MCLIVFGYKIHPDYDLILTANRDEFYNRPTAVASWWEDHPELLGGRDLQAGGTWMAIHKDGRFSTLTNYRDIKNIKAEARSRGDLPLNFLLGASSPTEYLEGVSKKSQQYNGFNLLVMDGNQLCHFSNYEGTVNNLQPGVYGLSNALLDTPWPKVSRAKTAFEEVIKGPFTTDQLIELMQDVELAPEDELPDTGLAPEMEKALSSMCIRTPAYGTCCSTAVLISKGGDVHFQERSYAVGNRRDQVVTYNFQK